MSKKSLVDALNNDENFHFPDSGEVYVEIQKQQEFDKKEKVVKDFLKQKVLPEIDRAIKDHSTFVHVDFCFRESLSLELQEVVLQFLESKEYKIIDRNFEYGDSLRFEIGFKE